MDNIHKEVIVFVVNDNNEVLLQKRSANKKHFPNKWTVLSGHVEDFDDTFEAAAVRELKEEIGLTVNISELKYLTENEVIKEDNSKHITKYYSIISNKQEDEYTIQTEELSEVKWYSCNDFVNMMENNDERVVFSPKILEVFKSML